MSPRQEPDFLYRQRGKIYERWYGTFDLETEGFGGKFLDATVCTEDGPERYRSLEDLFSRLLNPPRLSYQTNRGSTRITRRMFTWYAHNGAKYDFTYLALMIREYAVRNNVQVDTTIQGRKIIALTIPTEGGKVRLADSFPLLQSSLANAAKAYAPEYAKAGHCPDHDFTKKNVFYDPDCKTCVAYALQDAVSLFYVMKNVTALLGRVFKVMPGLTTGSTAVKAWVSMIPRGHVYYRQHKDKEAFAQSAGVGSIIYPGDTSEEWTPAEGEDLAAVTLDRGAAFAACMKQGGYPVSAGIWTDEYEETFGFWEVIAESPPGCTFPVIPYSTDKDGRIFALGKGRAFITSEQYSYALECGYKLTIVKGLVFNKLEDIFSKFIQKCEDLEYPPDGSAADPAVKAMVKNMRNSLNGKFNTKTTHERIMFGPAVDKEGELIPGAMPWVDEDGTEIPGVFVIIEESEVPYRHPDWYAITVTRQALCMIKLIRQLPPEARGKVDTDSITTRPREATRLIESGLIVMGRQYGAFKVEHGWRFLQSIGPKNYRGLDDAAGLVNYCKGISRGFLGEHRDEHRRAGLGERIQLQMPSVSSIQEMIKTGADLPATIRLRSISTPASVTAWSHDQVTKKFSPRYFLEAS